MSPCRHSADRLHQPADVAAAAFAAPLALVPIFMACCSPPVRCRRSFTGRCKGTGAAFVAAGLVSVLLFPLTALSLLRAETAPQAVAASP